MGNITQFSTFKDVNVILLYKAIAK